MVRVRFGGEDLAILGINFWPRNQPDVPENWAGILSFVGHVRREKRSIESS